MTDNKKILNIAKSVISIEKDSISQLESQLTQDFSEAVQLIFSSKGRVIIAGVGKSANIANKIVASPFSKENYSEELIIGGSSEIKVEKIWTGDGNFELSDNPIDNQIIREESEINKVEIWENLEMSVGYAQK